MKKLPEKNEEITHEWIQKLRNKYEQMSMIQLKKQKFSMVKDLEEINALLDNVIKEQLIQQPKTVEDLDSQIEKNKKLQRGLKRSLQNFQFMLTGDYSVKSNDELIRLRNQIKVMKQQIHKFNRMLSVPIQKDIQLCEQLQRQVFRLQKDVEQGKAKIIRKRQRMNQIASQNKLKTQQFDKINKQIKKLIESVQHQQSTKIQKQNVHLASYQQLMIKKNKLLILIDRDQKRYSKQYKTKAKKFSQIQEASLEMEHFLKQVQYTLIQKNQELNKVKQRSRIKTVKNKRNSESNSFNKRKIRTQQNSQVENLIKNRQQRHHLSTRHGNEQQSNFDNDRDRSIQSSNLLPRLYKALGKSKLRLQEDCDVKDLIYS